MEPGAPSKGAIFACLKRDATQLPSLVPTNGGSSTGARSVCPSGPNVTFIVPSPVFPPELRQLARTPFMTSSAARAAFASKPFGLEGGTASDCAIGTDVARGVAGDG